MIYVCTHVVCMYELTQGNIYFTLLHSMFSSFGEKIKNWKKLKHRLIRECVRPLYLFVCFGLTDCGYNHSSVSVKVGFFSNLGLLFFTG